jgi:hypothetical protein
MANVLNPETESITLNTELETPTLEPATELEQPSFESTSNPETAEVVENPVLDADTTTTELVSETEAEPTTEAVQQLPRRAGCRSRRSGLRRLRDCHRHGHQAAPTSMLSSTSA